MWLSEVPSGHWSKRLLSKFEVEEVRFLSHFKLCSKLKIPWIFNSQKFIFIQRKFAKPKISRVFLICKKIISEMSKKLKFNYSEILLTFKNCFSAKKPISNLCTNKRKKNYSCFNWLFQVHFVINKLYYSYIIQKSAHLYILPFRFAMRWLGRISKGI